MAPNIRPKRGAQIRERSPETVSASPAPAIEDEAPSPTRRKLDVNLIARQVAADVANGKCEITPLTPPRRKFAPSAKQVDFLRKLGCPDAKIVACKSNKEVDDLFKAYKNIPTQWQIDWLRGKGVSVLPESKDAARAIITRLRKELPASDDQMDYIKVLWLQHQKTSPLPSNVTDFNASGLIGHLKRTRPITEGQRTQLRAFGMTEAEVIELFCFL
jgi:hypothetical protein